MAQEKQRNGRRLEVGNAVKVCGVGYPGYNHISIYTYLYIIVIYIYIYPGYPNVYPSSHPKNGTRAHRAAMDPHMSTLRYDLRRTEDELRQASRTASRGGVFRI